MKRLVAATCVGLSLTALNCGTKKDDDDPCSTGDQDGVGGGNNVELVSVSDTGFTVGGVDSGSTEPNIAVENLANVTLTLTNTGTKPHDMVIQCIPTGLPASCMNPTSCFPNPADAGSTSNTVTLIPALAPGASQTITFVTPPVEGVYDFISDVPADNTQFNTPDDAGVTGNLTGDFVLM